MQHTATLPGGGLLTLGQIAARLRADGVCISDHQLKYALTTYRIEPAGRVGILRVWNEDAIPLIKSALRRIASNKGARL